MNPTDTTTLIGPFSQLLPMDDLALAGPLKNEELTIIENGGIVTKDGKILQIGSYKSLQDAWKGRARLHVLEGDCVGLPGLIDAHTHICFGGSRAMDYAARNNGKTYQEIAAEGGGIWSTVKHTREASQEELTSITAMRMNRLLASGITTVEVKSGYGLGVKEELTILRAIKAASAAHAMTVVPTCLAAHIVPKDFSGGEKEYLDLILAELVPIVKQEQLATRFDIFTEENAFSIAGSLKYLKHLKREGFDLTVHGDQFSVGGSAVAIEVGARSVDHLEASGDAEIQALSKSSTVPVVLPGASIGLGIPFAPARKILDAGCALAIASDWNPGSGPQGDLLIQASLLGAYEKLSSAEVFAGITTRAAAALGLEDKGKLAPGTQADVTCFPIHDFREIFYQQGMLRPSQVFISGKAQL